MSIKVSHLFYTYMKKTPNEVEALHDINLTIENNSYVAFVGTTGSGKSTLIQNLNALLIPTLGTIEVDDFVITNNKKRYKKTKQLRKHVGLVFQFPEYQLFEETVEKDVAFGLKNYGYSEKEALEIARKTLLKLGIPKEYFLRSPFELSGGEKRRVALAGILALDPDILVLDEPTSGLSIEVKNLITDLIDNLHRSGKTIIVVTHDMDLVLKYCQKVFVLSSGKLVFEGTPIELFSGNHEEYGLEVPPLYLACQKLIKNGVPLDITNIKIIDDLLVQIKEWKSK